MRFSYLPATKSFHIFMNSSTPKSNHSEADFLSAIGIAPLDHRRTKGTGIPTCIQTNKIDQSFRNSQDSNWQRIESSDVFPESKGSRVVTMRTSRSPEELDRSEHKRARSCLGKRVSRGWPIDRSSSIGLLVGVCEFRFYLGSRR